MNTQKDKQVEEKNRGIKVNPMQVGCLVPELEHEWRVVPQFYKEVKSVKRKYCVYCIHCLQTTVIEVTL